MMTVRFSGIGIVSTLALLLGAHNAFAQDVGAGETIAKTWCAGCHEVSANGPKSRSDATPPSFLSVANMSSTTAMSLSAFLSTSHPRMPDYTLSRNDIANVSAYILSLRKEKTP
jgi:mono/diheme cytochrome c family protein